MDFGIKNSTMQAPQDTVQMENRGRFGVQEGLTVQIEAPVSPCETDSSITQVTQLSPGENLSFIENDPELKNMIPRFETDTWYIQPCFRRYWQHYQQVMAWCQKHYQLVRQQSSGCYTQMNYNPYNNPYYFPHQNTYPPPEQQGSVWMGRGGASINTQRTTGTDNGNQNGAHTNHKNKNHRKEKKNVKTQASKDSKQEEMYGSESDLSSSVDQQRSEIDLTEEMIQFFSHTLEHRKERDEQKKHEKTHESEDIMINIESVSSHHKKRTAEAPKQRPGSQRTAEMKILYGKGAPMIHGMETALQMTFDRNTDLQQPKYWPNMPLKVVFG